MLQRKFLGHAQMSLRAGISHKFSQRKGLTKDITGYSTTSRKVLAPQAKSKTRIYIRNRPPIKVVFFLVRSSVSR